MHPSFGDDLLAVPFAAVEKELSEFRKVDRSCVERDVTQLKAVLLAVKAPQCWVLHSNRLPDFFLEVVAERAMRGPLDDYRQQAHVEIGVVEAPAWGLRDLGVIEQHFPGVRVEKVERVLVPRHLGDAIANS